MNGLVEGVIIAIVPIGVVNTGALIYFAGLVAATLREHEGRLKRLEREHDLAAIAGG